ncbi:MAG: FG-GAP-like repeat-containing protein [bacterium]
MFKLNQFFNLNILFKYTFLLRWIFFIFLLFLLFEQHIYGQSQDFTDINAQLIGVMSGSVRWGDYDNDGDLDLLLMGRTTTEGFDPITKIYRNENGIFLDSGISLPNLWDGEAEWGDYDNDGDLDILLTGATGPVGDTQPISKVFRNDQGDFVDIDAGLTGASSSSVAWGDYDNDGDLDIILTGRGTSSTLIYQNDNGGFTKIDLSISIARYGDVVMGDIDNDSDLDMILTGANDFANFSEIYENSNGNFSAYQAGLRAVESSDLAVGDYDLDGDLDIFLMGTLQGPSFSALYQNNDGNFEDTGEKFAPADLGEATWGDYNNDGIADLLVSGDSVEPPDLNRRTITKIYKNEILFPIGNFFSDIGAPLDTVRSSTLTWGDYDNDGDLDIVLAGHTGSNIITKIYRNEISVKNTNPSAPSNLESSISGSSVTLSWDAADDLETPKDGLTYNIRLGTTPGGIEIITPMADIATSFRRIAAMGNVNHNKTWIVNNLPNGVYYWSVQAIDHSFAGSAFADEQSFTVGPALSIFPKILDFGLNLTSQTFTISNQGSADLTWTLETTENWITVNPASGTTTDSDEIAVTVERAGLSAGFQSGNVIVKSNARDDTVIVKVNVQFTTLTAPNVLDSGTKSDAYRIISIPARLDNPSPGTILNFLGEYKKKWRLFDSEDGRNINIEFPNTRNFDPGVGLLLIVKESGQRITAGAGSFLSDTEFSISLISGWNLIGNPYNRNIPIGQLSLTSGQQVDLWTFVNGWQDTVTVMEPWKGYAISVTNADMLRIAPFSTSSSSSEVDEFLPSDKNWRIQISARCETASDQTNYVGVREEAVKACDRFDLFEPPTVGDYVMLSFPHPEWGKFLTQYSTDYQAPDESGYVWDFEVRTNYSNSEVKLNFDLDEMPQDKQLRLVDERLGVVKDLRRDSNYLFVSGSSKSKKSLRLLVGNHDSVEGNSLEIQTVPDSYVLSQNFPNPFNPATIIRYGLPKAERVTLKVYNLLGEEVLTLVNDKYQSAGVHFEIWNGRNKDGRRVASGIYVYHLRAGRFSITKKMALIR